MARREIQLTPQFSQQAEGGASRIRIDAVSTDASIPSAIFRYLLLPLQPGQTEQIGRFDGICWPAELDELAEGEPFDSAEPPWFRLDYVDLVVNSAADVEEVWQTIRDETQHLLDTLARLDRLTAAAPAVLFSDSAT